MNFASNIENERMKMNWWVKIITARPLCTYYFGPFESTKEAVLAQPGYIEDLVEEGVKGIAVQIKWCKPKDLTTFLEDELAESPECELFQIREQLKTRENSSYGSKRR